MDTKLSMPEVPFRRPLIFIFSLENGLTEWLSIEYLFPPALSSALAIEILKGESFFAVTTLLPAAAFRDPLRFFTASDAVPFNPSGRKII